MSLPFSDEEIRAAVRLIGTDDEAEAAVLGVRLGVADGPGSLTQDTLILLSLLSDDLARRVDEYRAPGRMARPLESEVEWLHRRGEIHRYVTMRSDR